MEAIQPATHDGSLKSQIDAIVHQIGPDTPQAADQVMGLLGSAPEAVSPLFHEMRRMVFLKGTNPHDYKYSSAVLEDYYHISPAWRNVYAAMSVFKLRGAAESDTGLLERVRSALA